jgi:hypothetical protein
MPCPCGANADCQARQACCMQLFPIPTWRTRDSDNGINQCSKFAAFPQYSNPNLVTITPQMDDVISSPLLPR